MGFVSPLQGNEIAESRPNPQKRNILIQRLALAPWWLLVILLGMLFFYIQVSSTAAYASAWEFVKQGITVTLRVTFISYGLALVMGLLIAILRRPTKSPIYNLLVYQPVTIYVEVVRGIPTLVLVYYMAFVFVPRALVPALNDMGDYLIRQNIAILGAGEYLSELKGRSISEEYRAIIALAISYSAFMSEIFRAGIQSVEIGQREAALSMGLSRWQVMRFVVLPQAFRNILPPLGNDFIALLKESSLVSAIGVADISRKARDFNSSTFSLFPGYNTVAVTYLAMTLSLAIFIKILEWYLERSRAKN